jgi:hypothetical protein
MRVKINYTQEIEYCVELDWNEVLKANAGGNSTPLPSEDEIRKAAILSVDITPDYPLAGILEGTAYEVDAQPIKVIEIHEVQ